MQTLTNPTSSADPPGGMVPALRSHAPEQAPRQKLERGLRRAWRPRHEACSTQLQPLLDRVLAARGLATADSAAFLSPSLKHLHDPSLLPGIERAAARILDALAQRHPIAIFGDYDVDGITATAILYHTLRLLAPDADVRTYVPHRLDEGYGLSSDALLQLASEGVRLVVSVDCGITAREPARIARSAGLDLIITDHHTPPALSCDLPDAYAVVHPRLPADIATPNSPATFTAYPFGDLCGAGVAYKLAWRLCTMHAGTSKVSPPVRQHLIDMLVPAALGVIADVVPLVGENRIIARQGLALMKQSSIVGLRALIDASRLASDKIDAEDVGFRLAPRLNAAGRMGHAREAVELLTTATGPRAQEIAQSLSRLNDQRRAAERQIADAAAEQALARGMAHADGRIIVLADKTWHRGVVGIACSRLVEKFGRPTILLQREGDLCTGSARSIDAYDLHAALATCSDLLEKFGGHAMAAGLCVRHDRLPELHERLQAHAASRLEADDLVPSLQYDATARLPELTLTTITSLASLAPFGAANPRVRLLIRGARLCQPIRSLGSSGDHIALHVEQDARTIRVVGWNFASHVQGLRQGQTLDVMIEPKLSTWSGQATVEPELTDLRLAGN